MPKFDDIYHYSLYFLQNYNQNNIISKVNLMLVLIDTIYIHHNNFDNQSLKHDKIIINFP